jgi:hypothetical protein
MRKAWHLARREAERSGRPPATTSPTPCARAWAAAAETAAMRARVLAEVDLLAEEARARRAVGPTPPEEGGGTVVVPVATAPRTVDDLDLRDALLRLAATEPEAFRRFLCELGLDLKGAVYRHAPGPYAQAAREAGLALDDVALRYGRAADAADAAADEGPLSWARAAR